MADKWHWPCAHGRAVGISGACILIMVVLKANEQRRMFLARPVNALL